MEGEGNKRVGRKNENKKKRKKQKRNNKLYNLISAGISINKFFSPFLLLDFTRTNNNSFILY